MLMLFSGLGKGGIVEDVVCVEEKGKAGIFFERKGGTVFIFCLFVGLF